MNKYIQVLDSWEARLDSQKGQRGNGPSRERLKAAREKYMTWRPTPHPMTKDVLPHLQRQKALGLARMAQMYYDEHGSQRGDHLHTKAIDYIPPSEAALPPYHDQGRGGIGLVAVARRRVYAKSSKWYPRDTSTYYLVGRNEAGTFWSHPVVPCKTVIEALNWIWNGYAANIIQRQGDIALVQGAGPKYPSNLPAGHVVTEAGIVHATHPTLPLPGKGERIIVARRAVARVSEATRD